MKIQKPTKTLLWNVLEGSPPRPIQKSRGEQQVEGHSCPQNAGRFTIYSQRHIPTP